MKGQITSVMCLGKSESSLYTGMLQGSKYGIQLLKLLITRVIKTAKVLVFMMNIILSISIDSACIINQFFTS